MSHTADEKLKALQKVMNNQCKNLKTCIKISCFPESEFIIIRKHSIISENRDTFFKFPAKDIDVVTIRERAKLAVQEKSKEIDEAIEEVDFIDKLKDSMK